MSKFPFFSMQQLNLDWLMKQMQKILAFLPIDSGHAGQILQRGSQSARWVNIGAVSMDIHGLETAETVTGSDELPVYNTSVEGNRKMTISALAAMIPSPAAPVQSVNGKTGDVVLDAEDVGALPDSYVAPVTSVNGQTGDVIVSGGGGGAVDSVNGKIGNVILTASDVGAMPDSYVAPVQSVNGQTGNVTLDAEDVGALPSSYQAPVTSVNGQTGNVVISATGIDFMGGSAGDFAASVYAGIGQLVDSDFHYKLSADEKWIDVWGCCTVQFQTTGDVTLIDFSGPDIGSQPQSLYYRNAAIVLTSTGTVDFNMSKGTSIMRLTNNIRFAIGEPTSTGVYNLILPHTLMQIKA